MVSSHAAKSGKEDTMHTCRTNYRLSDAPTRCEACALRETIYEALALGGMLAALTALTLLADLLRSS